MRSLLPFSLLMLAAIPAWAESRAWKSADGEREILAEFVERNAKQITLLRDDGQELTFELSKLHESDRKWLDEHHPVLSPPPPPSGVFDTLAFGDDRDTVFEKLKASKMVDLLVEEKFLGRFGLNGMFRTREAAGGMHCTLSFNWNEGGGLAEVNLQTEALPVEDYATKLKPCWKEYTALLTQIYGRAAQNGALSPPEKLESGEMLASHLWRLGSGGTTLLGIAREGNGYQIVIRITREIIQPVVIPGTATATPGPTFFDP